MLDNSSPKLKESSQRGSKITDALLTRSERAASGRCALGIASGEELWELSWQLVEILTAGDTSSPRSGMLESVRCWFRQLLGAGPTEAAARSAAAGLASRWADLPAPIRTAAVSEGRELLARRAAETDPVLPGRGRARLIADLREVRCAGILVEMLGGGDEEAAGAAEGLLLLSLGAVREEDDELGGIADWIGVPADEAVWSVAERAELQRRVAVAVEGYSGHRRDEVLMAAMVLLEPAALAYGGRGGRDPLVVWLGDSGHEAHLAFRGIIKRAPGGLARRRAWQLLGRGIADGACAERLLWARSSAEHASMLDLAHLGVNPARRKALRRARPLAGAHDEMRAMPGLIPSAKHLEQLSPAARRGVARIAGAIGISGELLERTAGMLAADEDAGVRLAALSLAPSVNSAAGALCGDIDPSIARHAALTVADEVERTGGELSGLAPDDQPAAKEALDAMRGSPFAGVRAIGERLAEMQDPWNWTSELSRLSARRWMERERRGFVRALRRRISGGTHEESMAGMMLARRLGIVIEFELELLQIAAGAGDGAEEQRLAATAVAALGELGSSAAVSAVLACLEHPVDRVRANAAEAMLRERWAGRPRVWARPALLMELKTDGHHRVRANTLRGLLTTGIDVEGKGSVTSVPARDELLRMLLDDRPLHRLAGLWALERVIISAGSALGGRWDDVVALVARLARDEPEAPVRERAARCGRLMLRQMRSDWSQRAGLATEGAAA